jgi:8-oxo-dGTP pyrophosphatase MutT (NUDIX family)
MQPLKSCGFLIVRGEPIESFLLMVHPDRLDIPKGHVDQGEDDLQCALRELQEETGIGAEDIQVVPGFRFSARYTVCNERSGYQPMEKTLVVFLGRLLRNVSIAPTEHLAFRWIPWSPPHHLQAQTIDPLLAALGRFLESRPDQPLAAGGQPNGPGRQP